MKFSEEDLPHATIEHKAGAILAITVPLACTLSSIAWAIAAYLMVREKQRAQVELARLGIGITRANAPGDAHTERESQER